MKVGRTKHDLVASSNPSFLVTQLAPLLNKRGEAIIIKRPLHKLLLFHGIAQNCSIQNIVSTHLKIRQHIKN